MDTSFVTLARGSSVIYGSCGGLWTMTVFASPTVEDMFLARSALTRMRASRPGGFPTLTWILPQAGYSMSAEARHAAAEVTREAEDVITALATLIEERGFQAAAVRAIVAGLDMVSRARAPKKVFADLPHAVHWCSEFVQDAEPQARRVPRVEEALARMRSEL